MSAPASDVELAQFFLYPYDEETAEAIAAALNDPRNMDYAQANGFLVRFSLKARIKIGSSRRCDIVLPRIDSQQCYFKRHEETNAVILKDISADNSTHINDREYTVALTNEARSVVVTSGMNRVLHIGRLSFELSWPSGGDSMRTFLGVHRSNFGPNWSRDYSECRYLAGRVLGHGASGHVFKAVDIRTGDAIAVKHLEQLNETRYDYAIREIRTMKTLSEQPVDLEAKHILRVYDSIANETNTCIEIFLPLKDGSVATFIHDNQNLAQGDLVQLAQEVLYQMSKALNFLEEKRLIHRDVKPENILYKYRPEDEDTPHYFYLADFGLARDATVAITQGVGTTLYMAPEVYFNRRQTCRMDVWSLFVTVVWILDTDGFRRGNNLRFPTVVALAERSEFVQIKDMAAEDYRVRVKASTLLRRLNSEPWALASVLLEDGTDAELVNYTHVAPMDGHSALAGFSGVMEYVPPDVYNPGWDAKYYVLDEMPGAGQVPGSQEDEVDLVADDEETVLDNLEEHDEDEG